MTEKRVINLAAARKTVLAQIEKKGPDYVYERVERPMQGKVCSNWYEEDGKRYPSCLVGYAIDAWGWIDMVTDVVGVTGVVDDITAKGVATFTDAAEAYLDMIQCAQDDEIPWGHAEEFGWNAIQRKIAGGEFDPETEKASVPGRWDSEG